MKKKTKKKDLIKKKKQSKNKLFENKKDHPPKKSNTFKNEIKSIFPYSAKKNIANIIEEYSTLYPATISASASGKSNGVLFVSAKEQIKKQKKHGNKSKKKKLILSELKLYY